MFWFLESSLCSSKSNAAVYVSVPLETSSSRRTDGVAWLPQVCRETYYCRHQGPKSTSHQYEGNWLVLSDISSS